jgi:hypothetical protein
MVALAHRVLCAGAMQEFLNLDRCAAFVAARSTMASVQHAVRGWPPALADRTRRAAATAVDITAEATSHRHASADRRRCLRDAITSAVGVADAVDRARALGFDDDQLDELQRVAGRSVALLGMFLHANTSPMPES